MMDLLKLRKDKGVRQEDVAKAIGVSRQAIAAFESEQIKPSIDTAKKLAEYYGLKSWAEIFEEGE